MTAPPSTPVIEDSFLLIEELESRENPAWSCGCSCSCSCTSCTCVYTW